MTKKILKIFQWIGFLIFMAPMPLSFLNMFGIINWSWWVIGAPYILLFVGTPILFILMLIALPIMDWSLERSIKKTNATIDRVNKLLPILVKKRKREERIKKLEKLKENGGQV